jgi:hypothetical protein
VEEGRSGGGSGGVGDESIHHWWRIFCYSIQLLL